MEGEGGREKGGKGQVQRVQNGLPINSVVIGAEISRLNERGKKKTKKKPKKKKHEILARLHSRAVTESTNERIYRKVGWLMFSLECRF